MICDAEDSNELFESMKKAWKRALDRGKPDIYSNYPVEIVLTPSNEDGSLI
jgi:hypothetical protein